jgi:arginyl-tRNA synthetase
MDTIDSRAKMSTRKGTAIHLEEILNESVERAKSSVTQAKPPKWLELEQ